VPGAAGTAALGAAAGAGWLLGPLCAGLLATVWGWRPALLVMAVLTLPAATPFLRGGRRELVSKPLALRELVELARTTPAIAWSAAVAGLLGAVTGTIAVLVPTLLAANGIGPAGIGAAVMVSSVVWIVASACAGRIRRLRIGLPQIGAAVAALALVTALPVLSGSTAVLVGFLVLAAACRAPLGALIYPLATRSVKGEVGGAAIGSLLHLAWAAAGLLAGAAMQEGFERAAFAAVCLVAVGVATGILGTSRRLALA
jgi:predicted MFS family arabinose efflux permease